VEVRQPQVSQKVAPLNEISNNKPQTLNSENSQSGETVVVGSRTGSKYHLPSCPGAKQIKTENLINFSSIADAEAAGYKPAANCPQLQ